MPIVRRLTEAQKRLVAARAGWHCEQCGAMLASQFQIDHVTPLWAGGADDVSNCQALCPNCHALKTQRESVERAATRRMAREAAARLGRRPPVECTGCGALFSPYFGHRCSSTTSPKTT